MKDQGWHIELLEVFREVRLGESLDAVIARFFVYGALRSSNTEIGAPAGFLSVFTINGGTALMSTAMPTRFEPCRPMYRANSPPPVECPTWIAFFRSSFSVSAARSSA